jgi:hypothetical protein
VTDTTTQVRPSPPSDGGGEGERILLALAGEPERYCMYCDELLLPGQSHDSWAHTDCERVVKADDAANEVHDNGPLSKVERKLRRKGKCSWQIRAPGMDGGGIYCGRDIVPSTADLPSPPALYCLEHQCEADGDEEGAAEERRDRTLDLLVVAQLAADTYEAEAEAIRDYFEYQFCDDCGKDLDEHTIGPDPLGHAHVWCNSDDLDDELSPDAAHWSPQPES